MQQLVGYHRPGSIADAVELLRAPGRMALAGGTTFQHDVGAEPVEVVDLQALGLAAIEIVGDRLRLGATTTLQALSDSSSVPEVVQRCATQELPSTLRSLATVGGTIAAADPESVLLAALIVHDAEVGFADDRTEPLGALLARGVGRTDLVVDVTIAVDGSTGFAAAGRTPADVPIVAALARSTAGRVRLALTGVAATPVLIEPEAIEELDPPADFRGSTAYRRHLARVLADRAIEELS